MEIKDIVANTRSTMAAAWILIDETVPKLKQAGYNVTVNDWKNYQNYDLALFNFYDSEIEKAKKINPNIITGIIDAKNPSGWRKRELELADFITATSLEQKDYMLKFHDNVIIYNHFLDIAEIPKTHVKKDKIIIGYHGNKVRLNGIFNIIRALDILAEKYDIEFMAIYNIDALGRWTKHLPKKCPVRHVQWNPEFFKTDLYKCDIGVVPAASPIREGRAKIFSKYLTSFFEFHPRLNWAFYDKCDYIIRFKYSSNPGRMYFYIPLHIPVVADFVPSNCQMIQHGVSGFLAQSLEGWVYALETLINDHELRNTMSANMKDFVDKNCPPIKHFEILNKFMQDLAAKR